jgi:hypothetical protein
MSTRCEVGGCCRANGAGAFGDLGRFRFAHRAEEGLRHRVAHKSGQSAVSSEIQNGGCTDKKIEVCPVHRACRNDGHDHIRDLLQWLCSISCGRSDISNDLRLTVDTLRLALLPLPVSNLS